MNLDHIVRIDYTNYRGERSVRRVQPVTIYFGHTDYHPESQWLMVADDVEKDARRTFAMKDIHSWSPDGVLVRYTDEPEQDAILAKFAAAGFKYDGNGSWRADLTTDELLTLAAGMEGKVK